MNAFLEQEMREEGRVGVERGGESGNGERRGEWKLRGEGRVGVERGGGK